MIVFERTENEVTEIIASEDALVEINHAMVSGNRNVRSMYAGGGKYSIAYKDGRQVKLVRVELVYPVSADEDMAEEVVPQETETAEWTSTGTRAFNLHRFVFTGTDPKYGDQYRARCNRGTRPRHPAGNDPMFRTRSDWEDADQYGFYTYCPRCEAK